MKMLMFASPALLAGAIAFFQAPAVPPMRMGLWEIVTNTKIVMPNMPAGMPGTGPRTVTMRVCMTPESYQKYLGQSQQMRDCTRSNEVWTSHSYSFDMSCNSGKMTGHSEGVFDSKEASHGTAHMQMNGGLGVTVDATASSKWIAEDCGAVTPDKPQIVK